MQRNNATELIKRTKVTFYQNFFKKNKDNCKRTWEEINKIIYPRRKRCGASPSSLKQNDNIINNKAEIADCFNAFFSSIGRNLSNNIRNSNKHFTEFLSNANDESFFLAPTCSSEIKEIISQLKNGKSLGPNSVPTFILKDIKDVIVEPLTYLVNLSFENGIYPDILKISKVIPLFKSGCRQSVDNYRPISLLSNINKII